MITLVVAAGNNNEIGKGNELLWHLPKDLKHFKNLTNGYPVIMGRKTYESIGKPLPNRTNIVLTSAMDWFEEGILIVHSLKAAVKHAKKIDEKIFIIGGETVFQQSMDVADRIEMTRVDMTAEADTFFPAIDPTVWGITSEECVSKDEKNAYDFCFQTFARIEKPEEDSGK